MISEASRYFPDISFEEISPLTKSTPPLNTGIILPRTGNPSTLDTLGFISPEVRLPWTPEQTSSAFQTTMKDVEGNLGIKLPTEGRRIKFVPQQSLIPTDPGEKARYLHKYGPDILDKLPKGRPIRNSDGTFDILIADLSYDMTSTFESGLGTLAHEYGHTLGEELVNPILEEMKAETFKLIFLKTYKRIDTFNLDLSNEKSNIHHMARSRLIQLINRGVCEEAILAHLLGNNFGKFTPDDYRNSQASGLSLSFRKNPTDVNKLIYRS